MWAEIVNYVYAPMHGCMLTCDTIWYCILKLRTKITMLSYLSKVVQPTNQIP